MLFGRLLGQETEYAIRFSPERRHPGNDVIYDALARAIAARVRTQPGMLPDRPQIFTENGGAFHYEYLPYCAEGGLVEGATPECRGPAQLLLYQKAQEELLVRALPDAERHLRASGFPGKLGLLKNCRDAEGHVYGAQESFEVPIARGPWLFLYRAALFGLFPLLAVTVLLGWAAFVALALLLVVGALALSFVVALPPLRHHRLLSSVFERKDRGLENSLGRFFYFLTYLVTWPVIACFSLLLHLCAFRRIRRCGTAFLVSRPVISGAGSLDEQGRFRLSEKGPSIRRRLRASISPNDRAIFDTGNLMKPTLAAALFQWAPMLSLFRREQRLQLGLADSTMLQEAEFLKAGTTALVIDMIEAGRLDGAPRLRRPIEALHALVSDPSLEARVETDRGRLSAVEIQRFYLEGAERFVRESRPASIEALEVLRLWRAVLSALERRDMARLVGRLDWVTKRYLLERCSERPDLALWKTIDLRYHELGEGYAARLEARGFARRLVRRDEVERAILAPPEGTPAFSRGRFIRTHVPDLSPVRISWASAHVGGRLRGRVVRFPSGGER